MVSSAAKRCGVVFLMKQLDYSQRRACELVKLPRSTGRYRLKLAEKNKVLTAGIRSLAQQHPSYGYRRITALLKRAGLKVNCKRVHRIWKEQGLQVPNKRKKRRYLGPKGEVAYKAEHKNQVWSYDILEDRTEKGGKLRILTVLDEYTRESLAIRVERSVPALKVIDTLEWLFFIRGAPSFIRSDNVLTSKSTLLEKKQFS